MAESHSDPSEEVRMNSIDSAEYERLARHFYDLPDNDEGSNSEVARASGSVRSPH